MTGPRIESDSDQALFAIFEALNWAVVVDNRLKKTASNGERWATGYDQGEYVVGFRYARNAVHHDWAAALYVDLGGVLLPTPLPAAFFEWCWQPELHATNDRGRAKYRAHLAGQPVRFTLEALEALYAKAVSEVL